MWSNNRTCSSRITIPVSINFAVYIHGCCLVTPWHFLYSANFGQKLYTRNLSVMGQLSGNWLSIVIFSPLMFWTLHQLYFGKKNKSTLHNQYLICFVCSRGELLVFHQGLDFVWGLTVAINIPLKNQLITCSASARHKWGPSKRYRSLHHVTGCQRAAESRGRWSNWQHTTPTQREITCGTVHCVWIIEITYHKC